jgi:putative membrane protein
MKKQFLYNTIMGNKIKKYIEKQKSLKMTKTITLFLKGFLMGIFDIIPGISGGTIAFILGIYLRLMNAIKNITPKNIIYSIKNPKLFKKFDYHFLIILFLGIITAIFTTSKLIVHLLGTYQNITLIFFVGLILASSKIIYKDIDNHKIKDKFFVIIGLTIGIMVAFLSPSSISDPSYSYILFAGFLAISAMFLPGISGSFILLVLGVYEVILSSLHNLREKHLIIIAFLMGAIMGAGFISRAISFLYKKDKSKTLYTILGIVLGTLLVPLRRIYLDAPSFDLVNILILGTFFILGILIIKLVEKGSNKKYYKEEYLKENEKHNKAN